MIIKSRAPVRISYGGGGTDVSPYTEDHGGVALNVTINKYVSGSLELSPDNRIILHSYDYNKTICLDNGDELKYNNELDLLKAVVKHSHKSKKGLKMKLASDVPPRSGLGGSATAFVAALGLFNHLKDSNKFTPYELAEFAYKLERRELRIPGGRQDQYAASFGGLNFIEFKGDDFVRVTPLNLKRDYMLELEENTLLFRVPPRKKTDDILADQKKNLKTGKSLSSMHRNKEIAYKMKDALYAGDFQCFGGLLHEAWETKKQFSSLISNPMIDKLYNTAIKNGALGGKITGAGGGGHMIFFCDSDKKRDVMKSLTKMGARPVSFSFNFEGLETWEVN